MGTERVVVVGGTGFLGSRIVAGARAAGFDTVVAARRPGADGVEVDVTDPGAWSSDWRSALAGADTVVLAAGSADIGASLRSHEHHVTGTANVLAAAARSGVGRVVLVSSVLVYGDARFGARIDGCRLGQRFSSSYALAKWRAECLLEQYDGSATAVRVGLLVGDRETGAIDEGQPLVRFVEHALDQPVLPLVDGGAFPALVVPVDDAADDVIAVLADGAERRVVLSVSPDAPTVRELLTTMLRPFGVHGRIVRADSPRWDGVLRGLARSTNLPPEWLAFRRPWAPIDPGAVERWRVRTHPPLGDVVARTGRAVHRLLTHEVAG